MRLLTALLSRPSDWRHGYELIKEAEIRSGTLYPLLMRLADQGLLETEWQPAARAGLPPRHAYRLTPAGIAFAQTCLASVGAASTGLALA